MITSTVTAPSPNVDKPEYSPATAVHDSPDHQQTSSVACTIKMQTVEQCEQSAGNTLHISNSINSHPCLSGSYARVHSSSRSLAASPMYLYCTPGRCLGYMPIPRHTEAYVHICALTRLLLEAHAGGVHASPPLNGLRRLGTPSGIASRLVLVVNTAMPRHLLSDFEWFQAILTSKALMFIWYPTSWQILLRWTRPSTIFVNSMSDLFQEVVPTAYIRTVVDIMLLAPWHTFQVLTKRATRLAASRAIQSARSPDLYLSYNSRLTSRFGSSILIQPDLNKNQRRSLPFSEHSCMSAKPL